MGMSNQISLEQMALAASLPFCTRFYVKGLGKVTVKKTVDPGNGLNGVAEFYLKEELIATYTSPFFGNRVMNNRRTDSGKEVVNFDYQEELIAHVLDIDPDTIEYYGLGEWSKVTELLEKED
jgi:hypothetical protein